MNWSRFLRADYVTVACTLMLVALVYAARGNAIFSPGSLHARPASSTKLGGVRSHAELRNQCGRCHPSPWGGEKMGQLCLSCHEDVHQQIDERRSLHGRMADAMEC